jgi:hypothetical protein
MSREYPRLGWFPVARDPPTYGGCGGTTELCIYTARGDKPTFFLVIGSVAKHPLIVAQAIGLAFRDASRCSA